jgi:hypothetical protein
LKWKFIHNGVLGDTKLSMQYQFGLAPMVGPSGHTELRFKSRIPLSQIKKSPEFLVVSLYANCTVNSQRGRSISPILQDYMPPLIYIFSNKFFFLNVTCIKWCLISRTKTICSCMWLLIFVLWHVLGIWNSVDIEFK